MTDELRALIEKARHVRMTAEELEQKIISFSYGNGHYENDDITREQITRWVAVLKEEKYANEVAVRS